MDPHTANYPLLSYILHHREPNSYPPVSPDVLENLSTRFPHFTNPRVLLSLSQSIPNIAAQTHFLLRSLGPRPDPGAVSSARSKIAQLQENGSSPDQVEKEMAIFKAVVRLEELHVEYEKQLRDVEVRLSLIYGSVVEEIGDGEVNEEVVRILKEAESGVVERVELSGRQLKFLPEAFGKLHGLISLDLSHNEIKVYPDAISGLQKLEELDVSSNLLESLPDSIGLLLNLRVLNVSGNKLNALPESIARCSSLVVLDASFNNLTCLPANIGYGLPNLERLSIQLNNIYSLPSSICEMRSLRYLDVHFNKLHQLPRSIGRLTNLEVLNLSNNFSDLTELPETLGDLLNVRELDLSNNQIQALPDTFYRLEKLRKLNLDQNPLRIPPMEVANNGAEAVREFMAKRWVQMIEEEQEKSMLLASKQEAEMGWLAWGSSLLTNIGTGISRNIGGYLGVGKASRDPYLDQQL